MPEFASLAVIHAQPPNSAMSSVTLASIALPTEIVTMDCIVLALRRVLLASVQLAAIPAQLLSFAMSQSTCVWSVPPTIIAQMMESSATAKKSVPTALASRLEVLAMPPPKPVMKQSMPVLVVPRTPIATTVSSVMVRRRATL